MTYEQVCSGEILWCSGETLVAVQEVQLLTPHSLLREFHPLQPVLFLQN
ncbi:MAG: hypothetical protein KBC35_03050 [Candidatus Pacebacteria bacterium]|nr:hypothetical protein [Candidatus Paceibacterota bacterium]